MRKILVLIMFVSILSCKNERGDMDFVVTTTPSFKVNYSMPTADKPQSKLWFMNNHWWALLPDNDDGPTLWQRNGESWTKYPGIAATLRNVPGRADVWPEKDRITAVGVGDSSLTVFRLTTQAASQEVWEPVVLEKLFPPVPGSIETATIARDGKGNWWVAATSDSKVCVWNSVSDGESWSEATILAEDIDSDDISVVTPVPGGVGVIWSDQNHDGVFMRIHKDENPVNTWEEVEVAESGNNTADDHLNTSLSPDGTLWMATKNSVDKIGKGQFVFRTRSPKGSWRNIPYIILTGDKRPSRPIAIATEDNSYVFSAYGDNDRSVPYPYNSKIMVAYAPVDSVSEVRLNRPEAVIVPDSTYKFVVHNVTGPREVFPENAPWIILASDSQGNVYEADLKKLVSR